MRQNVCLYAIFYFTANFIDMQNCKNFHAHSGSVGRNKFNQLNRSIFGILPMIKYGMFHMILLCRASVGYLSELSCSSELTVGHSELKYWAHFSIFWHTVFFT